MLGRNDVKIKNSIVVTWLTSYIIISLLSLLGSFMIYMNAVGTIKENTIKINNELFENEKLIVEKIMGDITTVSNNFLTDEDIQNIAMFKTPLTSAQRYELIRANSKIIQTNTLDTAIKNMYIFFTNSQYVISSVTTSESHIFYMRTYGNDSNINYDEWESILHKKHNGHIVTFPSSNGKKDKIFYIKSITKLGYNEPVANIVMELERDVLYKKRDDREFLIKDKSGNIIVSDFDDETENIIKTSTIDESKRISTIELNDVKYIMLQSYSSVSNWDYIYLIDYNAFMNKILKIRWVLFASCCMFLAIGGIVVLRTIKRSHKPIQKIVQTINDNMHFDKRGDSNELEFIELALIRAIDENNSSIKKGDITESVIKEAMLAKYLKGSDDSGLFNAEMLKNVNIRFEYKDFAVVIISIEDIEDAFFDKKGTKEENAKLAVVVINNILNELLEKEFYVQECETEGTLVKILNADNIRNSEHIEKILSKASEFVMEHFNIEFIASISKIVSSIEQVPECYSQALEAMRYRYIVSNNIITHDSIDFNNKSAYPLTIRIEEQLINCLRSGEFEKGKEILNDIFETKINKSETPIALLRCLMYDIVGTMLNLLAEMEEISSRELINKINILDSLSRTTNVNLLKTEIIKLFKEFCDRRTVSVDNKTESIIHSVKEYIKTNFSDKSLSVQMLADMNGINSSYLSTLFKKNTATGLLEYITKVRMDNAKAILKSSDKTIEEVADMTGYSNSRTFSRVFVKHVGITPGKYKKS